MTLTNTIQRRSTEVLTRITNAGEISRAELCRIMKIKPNTLNKYLTPIRSLIYTVVAGKEISYALIVEE